MAAPTPLRRPLAAPQTPFLRASVNAVRGCAKRIVAAKVGNAIQHSLSNRAAALRRADDFKLHVTKGGL
jgi:hypothetical protein